MPLPGAEAAFMQRQALAEKLEDDLSGYFLSRSGTGWTNRWAYKSERFLWHVLRFFLVPSIPALRCMLRTGILHQKIYFWKRGPMQRML